MTELLEEEGYRVTISLALLDIDKVKDLAPEIIVHDLLVEQTQELGWKFLRQVRLDPELARIPLILCTASVRTIKEPDWRAPGAQAVPDRGLALRHRRGADSPGVDHRGDRGIDRRGRAVAKTLSTEADKVIALIRAAIETVEHLEHSPREGGHDERHRLRPHRGCSAD